MEDGARRPDRPRLRSSGYASRLFEMAYAVNTPFYDLLAWWDFLPMGGETRCREEFVRWFDIRPGDRVVSLCCGTGGTERAIARMIPEVEITALDLGAGQIARARSKDPSGRVDYRLGNAARTGLPSSSFQRVLITLALHEMPRGLRLQVLREAVRLCEPEGRVIAIEHGSPRRLVSRLCRALWWFYWLPFNPERRTTRDLQHRGLAGEMEEAGLLVIDRRLTHPDWLEGVIARRPWSGKERG